MRECGVAIAHLLTLQDYKHEEAHLEKESSKMTVEEVVTLCD
jgi:hypothetical protein